MLSHKNIRTHQAFVDYISEIVWRRAHAVTLFPRLVNSEGRKVFHLTESQLKENVRHFFNRLKRRLYGNKRRVQVRRLVCVEHRPELHLHCVIDVPDHISSSEFDRIVKDEWSKTFWGTRNCDTQPEMTLGWIKYIMKARSKERAPYDCVDLDNSDFDFDVTKIASRKAEH